ncbi:MAG TPA: YceI family protein [Chitinophagaceae bacterium]|nr:YceI family protein [Chitinophagaceae bacterium]
MSTNTWKLDLSHSEVQFKVKHLMISNVTGNFTNFSATVKTERDDFTSARIHFTADIDSISTNNEQRDAHLKNGDFFDAENHPQLSFQSSRLEKIDDENYKLYGTLTMRGTSKDVVLNVEYGGITQDPWGNTRAGFSVTGKIDRQDYGVSFGAVTETGGLLLSNEVKIFANVELVKEQVAVPV